MCKCMSKRKRRLVTRERGRGSEWRWFGGPRRRMRWRRRGRQGGSWPLGRQICWVGSWRRVEWDGGEVARGVNVEKKGSKLGGLRTDSSQLSALSSNSNPNPIQFDVRFSRSDGTGSRQQAAGSRQQAAGSRQQAAVDSAQHSRSLTHSLTLSLTHSTGFGSSKIHATKKKKKSIFFRKPLSACRVKPSQASSQQADHGTLLTSATPPLSILVHSSGETRQSVTVTG